LHRYSSHRRLPLTLRQLISVGGVTLVVALAAGCHSTSGPWDGVAPKDLVAIEQHRVRGIALLEITKTLQPPETYAGLSATGGTAKKSALDLAIDEFQAIIRTAPHLAFGYADLAVAYLELPTPRTEDALAASQQARERRPHDARILSILASAQHLAGRNEDAIRTLEEAARSPDAPVRVLFQLVELYRGAAQGRASAIGQLLERIAREAPGNLVAQLELAQAATETGQTQAARAALSRVDLTSTTMAGVIWLWWVRRAYGCFRTRT
jgi:tetratricopeptide (TPR) repeat protein